MSAAASRLGWWTRRPSLRSTVVLALPAAAVAALGLLVGPLVTATALAAAAVAASGTWWHGETAWRRAHPRLAAGDPLHADVDAVAAQFGLLRRPVVLLADGLDSPAAAVDTAHPGSTLLVTRQLLAWHATSAHAQVRAVLAHELAHLHRFHLAVTVLQRLAGTAAALQVTVLAGLQAAAQLAGVGPGGPADLPVLAGASGVAWAAVPLAGAVQSHVCELDADRDAARLGHGPALAAVFAGSTQRRLWRRGLFTHPHPNRRVRALTRPGTDRDATPPRP